MQYFKNQGKSVLGMKPVASGCDEIDGQLRNEDALFSDILMCIEWYHPAAYTFNQYYLSLFFELSILPDDLLKFNFNTRLAGGDMRRNRRRKCIGIDLYKRFASQQVCL
jgi:hypothetical protein